MKKIVKSMTYSLVACLILVSPWSTAAETSKRSIMLWGTQHRLMTFEADNKCAEQNEIVANAVRENPELIESNLPNFIFAVESADTANPNPRILSTDDPILKNYVGLYVHAGMSMNKLKDLLTGQNDPKLAERYLVELLANFYGFYFTEETHGDNVITKITNSIIQRDRNTPYLQRIKGDIDLITNLNSAPTQSFGPGALKTIKTYASSGNPADQAQLKATLDSYLMLSKSIAQEYFNQKIKPATQKYNITLDYPESLYNGKPAFTVVSPDVLFAETHMLGAFDVTQKHIQDLTLSTWRDHFIAQNIITAIKKNPNANMLFWFGEAHMPGVTRKIMLNKQLTLDEKSSITTSTQSTNPDIACNANIVIDSMIQKPRPDEQQMPRKLNDWYASYGLKDKSHQVIVYSIKGQKILSQSVQSSIAQTDLTFKITRDLKNKNTNDGVYFVQVQTQSNQDLSLFKILLN